MLRATFCIALSLLAPAATRDHEGPTAVQEPERAPGEVRDEPAAPGASPEPPVPGQPAVPVRSDAKPDARSDGGPKPGSAAKVRPKWWGPYPRPKITGFGGPVLQLSGLDRKFAAVVGIIVGATIKRRVSIGAAAFRLLNPADAGPTSVGAPRRLDFTYGALFVAVVFARTQRVDFTVEGLIGGGGACLQNPNTGSCYARTAMFVGQPGLAARITLAPIVRIAVGLGYRLVAARSWSGPADARLGAPVGSVMLEFGLF